MRDPNFSRKYLETDRKSFKYLKKDTSVINFRTKLDDETKIELIEKNFLEIMEILGLDMEDESLKDTPHRVAKMYVKEIFSGLNKENKPSVLCLRMNTATTR